MYIKSMVLEGFKSYGKRIEINDFDKEFNAITGFNGSGKSNILDAICFVLGITNLSQVRATSLQDLVYKSGQAGIQKATVTIIFDNHDRESSPIGYEHHEELVITRQIIIGGKNKYMINGSNVPNKRVQDLFCSVQLNVNNPHFLIMQGRITKVLNMKPLEILSMIEEASGTRMYETKKQMSLKTIEKKENKLKEINNVLEQEIAPKLNKLKEERFHYMEFQRVQRELDHYNRLNIAWEYIKTIRSNDEAEEQAQLTKNKINEKMKRISIGSKEIEEINVKLNEMNKIKNTEFGEQLGKLEEELKDVEKEQFKIAAKFNGNKEDIKATEKTVEQLKANIHDEEEILLVKEKEFEKVESLFKELKESDEKDSVALMAAQERYQKISSGLLQTENGENATLEQQLINAKQYVTQAQTELQQSQMSLDHAKTQLNTKLKDMRNTEDEYRKDSKVLEKKEKELKNLEDQLKRINYKDRSEELQAHKHTLKNEIRSLQEKIDLLEQRYPRLRFYYKKPDLHFKEDSVKGLVCTSLKIKNKDAAYALDLAAGGKLYNVIVDTEHNGMKLLERGQLQQRVTIIPLNKIDGRLMDSHIIELAEKLVGADKVQPALSLIDFSEEIRPAMTWIFGQIFICKDMETAEKIAFHKKIMKKCVTLEGDMFDPVGTLSGGAASKTESVLLKIEELNLTKDLLKQKQQDLLKIDEELIINEKAREEYAVLKDKYDLIKYEIDMVQQRLQQTMHHKTKEEVELLKTNIDNLMERIDAAKTLERDNLIKTKELECQLKDVVNIRENQLKEAENLLTTLKRKAEKSRAEWQKREEEFKTLELEMKELRGIIQTGKQQLVKVEDKLIELNEIGNAFAKELEGINAKVKSSRDRVKERKQIINQQNEEMQKLKAKKENITKQKSEDELEIKTLNHQIISFKEFSSKCTCKLIDLKKQYRWIEEDKQYFEKAGGMYDFKVNDPGEMDKKLKQLRTECKELKRNVNMRAINLLGKEEEQYNDMMKKKKIVENDKKKILETIQYLDRKKKEALQKAWEQVNRDFGSIFSSLLPGTDAKLVPPENQTITEGLEIKIGFSGIWKESLGELSGGQRSLVALSLILAMLLFKPAPLYILDEVDAALDLSHTENIGKMLKRHFKHSQFIVVSLKDGMFNNANVLFTTRFVDGMSTVIRTEKSKPKENKGEEVQLLQATSKGTFIDVTSNNILSNMRGSKRDWVFRVQVSDLEKNECLYVVGNLPELGAWNPNQAIQMFQEYNAQNVPDGKNKSELYDADARVEAGDGIYNEIDKGQIFSQKITLPVDADVDYRYFIAVICQSNGTKNSAKTLIIRKWETHMIPRQIKKNLPGNFINNAMPNSEIFGCYNGYCKVERGWLTDETVIQFKLFYNPIKLWKQRLQNRIVHIKMTPVNLIRQHSLELQQFGNECIDDSLSMDTQDIDQSAFSITEIAVMNDEETRFKYQEQFGRACKEDEFIIFNVAVRYPETVAYLVDYYVYSSRSFPGEPPNHIGFSYILPSTLQSSVGMLTVPITSTRHRPIGQLTIEYLVIKPIPNYPWDMSISYTKHWEQRWSGLDVGHRGLGTSFKYETKNCANVRENTLASLKTASYHGADMVEFDVQLSKDLVPVVYHDFYVSISLKRKKQIEAMDTLEIPVKELTLEQLHLLKVYHVAEGREKIARFFDEDLEDHQPFPTLQSVLLELEPHVGFNIEIKWTMQLKDGTFELNHPFDLNMYLDIILKVVLEYGGDRKIVFSSFNPDICAMIRLKQNKYPVVFLTQGVTTKYPTYHDPRCQTIPMAIRHALASDILGINVHTEDILRDPSQVKLVKDAGLIIFCWGDDNNDTDTIRHLKKLGLHAVIYDKMDVYNSKDVKESIFLVDARESQKALIALAQSSQAGNTQQNPITPDSINMDYNAEKEYFVDLNKTRNLLSTSTATSVSSLTNSSTAGDNISMIKMPSSWQQQSSGKNEVGGDFNVCAKSFGNPVKTINISDIVCGQATALPEAYVEDESAKDCL